MLSVEMRKRFVKDYSIPIQVVSDPYWDYFCNLYDELFGIKEKIELTEQGIALCNSEADFIDKIYFVRDEIINKIKETSAYNNFIDANNTDFTKGKYCNIELLKDNEARGVSFSKSSDVYFPYNDGKEFYSIDLSKANFQSLKFFDPEIVLNSKTYEELISNFTNIEYFKHSKYLRQVIFGNLNVSRQVQIERFLISKILNNLLLNGIKPEDVYVYTNDEIVFLANYDKEKIEKILSKTKNISVHFNKFKLKKIGDKDFYVKEDETGKVSFKKVPSTYFAQVFKYYKGMNLYKKDLAFIYENQLAFFDKPLFHDTIYY